MTGHRITARRGYDREELNADNRRKVMDAWKRFESSKPGVWLSRHTDLLERLSDEESHLVARVGAMVCVFALILSMVLFLAAQGNMLAWTLLTLPVFAVAFMIVMALWIFWDAYRDSGERAADWLSTRPGVATWRQLAADYGPRAINRDVVPSVLPRMLADFRDRKPHAIHPRPYLLFAVEFGVSMILSAVTGLCSGGLVYTLIRHVLKDRIALPPFFSIEVLGWGGIGFLLILVFATMLNQENILRMGNSTVLYEEKEAETIPNAVWRRIIFGLWVFDIHE